MPPGSNQNYAKHRKHRKKTTLNKKLIYILHKLQSIIHPSIKKIKNPIKSTRLPVFAKHTSKACKRWKNSIFIWWFHYRHYPSNICLFSACVMMWIYLNSLLTASMDNKIAKKREQSAKLSLNDLKLTANKKCAGEL